MTIKKQQMILEIKIIQLKVIIAQEDMRFQI